MLYEYISSRSITILTALNLKKIRNNFDFMGERINPYYYLVHCIHWLYTTKYSYLSNICFIQYVFTLWQIKSYFSIDAHSKVFKEKRSKRKWLVFRGKPKKAKTHSIHVIKFTWCVAMFLSVRWKIPKGFNYKIFLWTFIRILIQTLS